jgi:hypothetical protein
MCYSQAHVRGRFQEWVFVLAGECIRRGEGGGVGKGKKDTGYLYKAFMVARVAIDGS